MADVRLAERVACCAILCFLAAYVSCRTRGSSQTCVVGSVCDPSGAVNLGGWLICDYNSNIEYYQHSMPAGRGMTTSPVFGRPGVKLHEGKASGLVVKVWDAYAKSLLSFSLNERIHSWTTVHVSQFLLHFKIQCPFCP